MIRMLFSVGGDRILLGAALGIVAVLCFAILFARGGGIRRTRWIAGAVCAMCIGAVLTLTLSPSAGAGSGYRWATVNVVPGRSIIGQLTNVNRHAGALNILGNLAFLAIPSGFARVVFAWPVRRVLKYAFYFSASIEAAQFALQLGRSSDIDDVLLNVAGAWIGAAAAKPMGTRDDA